MDQLPRVLILCRHASTSSLGRSFFYQSYPSHLRSHDYLTVSPRSTKNEDIPIESHLSYFGHVLSFGSPCFIARRLTNFDLSVRVTLCNILPKQREYQHTSTIGWVEMLENRGGESYTERTAFFIMTSLGF